MLNGCHYGRHPISKQCSSYPIYQQQQQHSAAQRQSTLLISISHRIDIDLASNPTRPYTASTMQQRSRYTLVSVCLLLGLCCCLRTAAATRELKTGGNVKSETKVYADLNGGIDSKYKRVEKVVKKNDLKTKLLLAEAECKIHHDEKCQAVIDIKKQIAAATPAPAPKVTAPCYQNVIASYFLGTICELPPDSKADGKYRPADKGGRRLLAAVKWW